VDPSTGQKVINVQDTSLEIELLKQKDWFFINEGITTEYVTKKLKEFQEKDQAEILG